MATTTKEYLLSNQSYMRDRNIQVTDITKVAPAGLVPDYANYDGLPDALNFNVIPFVLHLPTMWRALGQDGLMIQAATKNLIENHFAGIEGLQKRLDMDTYDTDVVGGTEKMQNVTNVSRQQSNIVTTINDKTNRPIQRLLETWIRCGFGDEYSKVPLISLYDKTLRFNEILPSQRCAAVLFVSPNETKTRVDKAWLALNFAPKTTGENNGVKDQNVKGVGSQLSIEWLSLCQHSLGVDEMGQLMLDQLNRPALNPGLFKSAISEIHPDVQAATTGTLKLMDEKAQDMKHTTNNI